MGRGRGWMGHTPWWTPPKNASEEVRNFIKEVQKLIDGMEVAKKGLRKAGRDIQNSPSAATDPYVRYVQAYEIEVAPRHGNLQGRFERYLRKVGADELKPNVASVDLRYRDSQKGFVLAEIKPCVRTNVRYAIRTAMGQLLDYRQRTPKEASMLIVLEVKPNRIDQMLAISNGFGIAFPLNHEFRVIWPE